MIGRVPARADISPEELNKREQENSRLLEAVQEMSFEGVVVNDLRESIEKLRVVSRAWFLCGARLRG